jgi:transposase
LNILRGILRELGVTIPQGSRYVLPAVSEALASDAVPKDLHPILLAFCDEVRKLTEHIRMADRRLAVMSKEIPAAKSLQSIPGIGLLTSTALLGFVGSASRFRSSRRLSSFLGLVPREFSSGNNRHLGAITKRGDSYLRTLLIHGARSVLLAAKRSKNPDRIQSWALDVEKRRGHNRTATALANKLARVAWAVWSRNTVYEPRSLSPCN